MIGIILCIIIYYAIHICLSGCHPLVQGTRSFAWRSILLNSCWYLEFGVHFCGMPTQCPSFQRRFRNRSVIPYFSYFRHANFQGNRPKILNQTVCFIRIGLGLNAFLTIVDNFRNGIMTTCGIMWRHWTMMESSCSNKCLYMRQWIVLQQNWHFPIAFSEIWISNCRISKHYTIIIMLLMRIIIIK